MIDNDTSTPSTEDKPSPARRWPFAVWLIVLFAVALVVGRWVSAPDTEPSSPSPTAPAPTPTASAQPPPTPKQIEITGRVTGASGAPLQGASVTAHAAGITAPIEASTDAAGGWTAQLPTEAGDWELQFRARDHVSEVLSGYAPSSEPVVVELRTGGGLSGQVLVEATAAPLARVQVAGPGLWPPVDITADAEGRFVTPALPAGRYEVLARTEEHGVVATLDHDGRPGGDAVEVPLSPAGTLTISVQGPARALVTLAQDRVHVLSLAQWTTEGRARFAGLPPGDWVVRVRAPGFQEKIQLIRTSAIPAELVITPDPAASISGRVITDAGKPMELAQIVAHATTSSGGQWLLRRDPTGSIQSRGTPQGGGTVSAAAAFGWFTDEFGAFALQGLPAGQVVIEARQPGYQPAYAGPFAVGSGDSVADIELVLRPGLSLTVRVEGPIGPLAVARVEIAPVDAPQGNADLPAAFAGSTRELVTNDAGVATAAGLPSRVTVRAWADGHVEASQTVDIAQLGGEALVMRLTSPGATTRGRVLLGGELPLPGVAIARIAPPDEPVSVTACRAVTDDNGRFELAGCPEGTVWLSATPDADRAAPAVVESITGQDIEIRVEQPVALRVGVRGTDGAPVPRVRVALVPRQNLPAWRKDAATATTQSDDTGSALLEGLNAGPVTLQLRASGFQDIDRNLQLQPDMAPITVNMKPRIQLRGAVVDRYGAVVPGARVRVGTFTTLSGADGRFEVELKGSGAVTVHAVHTVLGRGSAQWTPGADACRLELDAATIDVPRYGERIAAAGISLWEDGARVVVEDVDERAHAAGARRGDVLIGAIPSGDRLALEADRAGKTTRYDVD